MKTCFVRVPFTLGETALMLDDGETLEIGKAPECAEIVEFDGYDPYEVLSLRPGRYARGA